MKNILVPTDFSDIAENAVHYAAAIAKATGARIILFHTYSVPFVSPEVPAMVPNINSIEEACVEQLKKLRAKIHMEYGPHLEVELEYRCGFATEEIELYIKEMPADLIVMGMRGDGYLGEKLIGSVTTSLMQQKRVPVLAVNKSARFNGLKKITFAYDYTALDSSVVLKPLKTLGLLFKSHIYVLKVCREGELNKLPAVPEAVAGVRMDHLLEGIDHSFHFTDNKNVVDGINHFVKEKNTDLVVMIPHQQSFFGKILQGSDTRHMAFHLEVPLLTLPE